MTLFSPCFPKEICPGVERWWCGRIPANVYIYFWEATIFLGWEEYTVSSELLVTPANERIIKRGKSQMHFGWKDIWLNLMPKADILSDNLKWYKSHSGEQVAPQPYYENKKVTSAVWLSRILQDIHCVFVLFFRVRRLFPGTEILKCTPKYLELQNSCQCSKILEHYFSRSNRYRRFL